MRAFLLLLAVSMPAVAQPVAFSTTSRVASVFISQDMINELLRKYVTTPVLQDLAVELDPKEGDLIARGLIRIPTEELKAINIEKGLGDFRFQVAIQPKATRLGHLILVFPLNETFFWPADSKDPAQDRVIIPVQLLSLALASARGYLAAISGDFTGFDRKTEKLKRDIARLGKEIAQAKDADERADLANERRGLQLQLEAVPIERRQLQAVAKQLNKIMGFTGEKEINLNEELAARRNALILRVKLGQLAPYLRDVELGGVRVLKDARDGGENFLAIDVNAPTAQAWLPAANGSARAAPQRPPSVAIRLNQALFESEEMLAAERQDLDQKIKNFSLELKEDGLHASGEWRSPLLVEIPFTAVVELVWVAANTFDLQVREVKVAFIDLKPLTYLVLEIAKNRLDRLLKGICAFRYVGEEEGRSRAVRVTLNMAGMLPAFPDLALTGIVTRDKELVLKAGKL